MLKSYYRTYSIFELLFLTTMVVPIQELYYQNINEISDRMLHYYGDITSWSENIIFSSASLYTLTIMLQLGAYNNTYDILSEFTGIKFKPTILSNKFVDDRDSDGVFNIMNTEGDDHHILINIQNAMFTNQYSKQSYVDNVRKLLNATVQVINFHDVENAISTIDNWIKMSTNGQINDMMKKSNCIKKSTELVLVNTIFFEGKWEFPFDPNTTINGIFHVDHETNINVQYMSQVNNFHYFMDKNSAIEAIKIPYIGNRYSALIILPQYNVTHVIDIESIKLHQIVTNLLLSSKKYIKIILPKFSIEKYIDLNDFLSNKEYNDGIDMGIIFDPMRCDFSGITDKPIYVSNVIQSAKIIVNEESTIAAAATAVVMTRLCCHQQFATFKANRPFIFLIWDDKLKFPIFTTFIRNPNL